MERSDIRCAVAEEADRNLAGLAVLRGPRSAGGDRHVRADDCIRTHGALFNVHKVHGAAFATQQPAFSPHQLTEDPRHRYAAHQCVVMAAIRTERVIVLSHGSTEAGRDCFLPQSKVRRPLNKILHKQIVSALFHHPAGLHQAIQLQSCLNIRSDSIVDGSLELPGRVIQETYL